MLEKLRFIAKENRTENYNPGRTFHTPFSL